MAGLRQHHHGRGRDVALQVDRRVDARRVLVAGHQQHGHGQPAQPVDQLRVGRPGHLHATHGQRRACHRVLGKLGLELGPAARVLQLVRHPARADRIGLGPRRHALALDLLGAGLRLLLHLSMVVVERAVAAAGQHQGARHRRIAQAEMQAGERAHGKPDDMGGGDVEAAQHAGDVVGRDVLGIGGDVAGHVRWRKAARVIGDAAISSGEIADLRLPASVVAGIFVHEQNRIARAGFLIVELHAFDIDIRHQLSPLVPSIC